MSWLLLALVIVLSLHFGLGWWTVATAAAAVAVCWMLEEAARQ